MTRDERSLQEVLVGQDTAGLRADRALARLLPQLSRREIQRLCEQGEVLRRGRPLRKSELLELGDRITLLLGPAPRALPNAQLHLEVRFESHHWVVVAKPAGQPSAPRGTFEMDTLANALVAAYPEMASVGYRTLEPGLLHRLDNGTSGLLVAARSAESFEAATLGLKQGHWRKRYLALVHGNNLPAAATISGLLEQDRCRPERVLAAEGVQITALAPSSILDDGPSLPDRQARGDRHQTRFVVRRNLGDITYVEVAVGAAFRHQIRAHFATAGWPLLNDTTYGASIEPELAPRRHALHAARVAWSGCGGFPGFDVTEPLAEDLSELLRSRDGNPH